MDEYYFIVAIDYSGSNGDPANSMSLHFLDPKKEKSNYYQQVIGELANTYSAICEPDMYGFGARLPIGEKSVLFSPVQQMFQIQQHSSESADRSKGVLDAYESTLKKILLAGPTHLLPILGKASRVAKKRRSTQKSILFILTDGIFKDGEERELQGAIEKASGQLLLVIVICMGKSDCGEMVRWMEGIQKGKPNSTDSIFRFIAFQDTSVDSVSELSRKIFTNLAEKIPSFATHTTASLQSLPTVRERYDAAICLAMQHMNNKLLEEAIESFSEAIALSSKLPSKTKDIPTLYNNRSAMHEKLKQYEACLRDIECVLSADEKHVKSRLRRGRVNESLGYLTKALEDYTFAILLERFSGSPPSIADSKMNELCLTITLQQLPELIKQMHNSSGRKLPPRVVCRNFFEAFPNTYGWKASFMENNDTSMTRDTLMESYITAKKVYTEIGKATTELYTPLLEAGLTLVKYHCARETYEVVFHLLHDIPPLPSSSDIQDIPSELISLYYEFLGTECHLKCQVDAAKTYYTQAMTSQPMNLSAQLKYGNFLNDFIESSKALDLYNHLLTSIYPESNASMETKICRAWILIHRVSLYISRDDKGLFHPQAIPLAAEDLSISIQLADPYVSSNVEAKGAKFVALIRSIYLRIQSKPQIAPAATEEESLEDQTQNKIYLAQAKALYPNHDEIVFLQAESLSADNDLTDAISILEKAMESHKQSPTYDAEDITPLVIKASILTNQAFGMMQAPQSEAGYVHMRELFREAQILYEEALTKDPTSIEVTGQYAQLHSMIFMDIGGAVNLLRRAMKFARNKDDIIEINQRLLFNEAQYKALISPAFASSNFPQQSVVFSHSENDFANLVRILRIISQATLAMTNNFISVFLKENGLPVSEKLATKFQSTLLNASNSVQRQILGDEKMSVKQLEALVERYKDAPEVVKVFTELQSESVKIMSEHGITFQ